jgi:hypothetical protein
MLSCGRMRCGKTGLIKAQLLYRHVEMCSCNPQAQLIKTGQLLFEDCCNRSNAAVARRVRSERFQGLDPGYSVYRTAHSCDQRALRQWLSFYRVKPLWKSTQGKYVARASGRTSKRPFRPWPRPLCLLTETAPAAPSTRGMPWPPLRPCPSAPDRPGPEPAPRSRPSESRCRWRYHPSSAP